MMQQYIGLDKFKAVYIVDLCHSLCEQAKAKVAAKGWTNVHVVEGDACEFVPAEGTASLVTFSYSLSSEFFSVLFFCCVWLITRRRRRRRRLGHSRSVLERQRQQATRQRPPPSPPASLFASLNPKQPPEHPLNNQKNLKKQK